MLKIAILDDSIEDINRLQSFISEYAQATGEKFNVDSYNKSFTFLDNIKKKYDIVFFDIDMPIINGIEVAKKLREIDDYVSIIFVTNLAQLAINGYEVSALDFLIKPLNYPQFKIALEKAMKKASQKEQKRVIIKISGGGYKALSYDDIFYIEVRKHDLIFVTNEQEYFTRGSLKDLESEINSPSFVKCNSCYLVNLKHVETIVGDEVYVGKAKLSMSRGKKTSFIDAFMNYIN